MRSAPTTVVSLALALVGVAVSAYLTLAHYDRGALVCGLGDCHTVQSSRWSEVGGVPIALLGLGLYAALAGLSLWRWRRADGHWPATLAAFALALGGALYSAYLTYLEVWVIGAICQWCVVSALLLLGLLVSESAAVVAHLRAPLPASMVESGD